MKPLHYFIAILVQLLLLIIILLPNSNSFNSAPIVSSVSRQIHYDLYVSSAFDSEEITIIDKAALEWNEATKHMVSYSVYYNFDDDYSHIKKGSRAIVVRKLSKWDTITRQYDDVVFNHTLGYFETDAPVPTIFLVYDRMLGDIYYKSVVMHELGHSLLMKHNENEGTLLYPSQDHSSKNITKMDIIEFCKIWGCNADELMPQNPKNKI